MLPRTLSRCVSCDILVDSCRVDSVCTRPNLLSRPIAGVEPTYKDCRPHIDATIRDLASKALNAGEEPSDEPPSHVYGTREKYWVVK